jgi:hypothetical protein
MPSPAGIFDGLGYTLEELQAFGREIARQGVFGSVTSINGGAKAQGKTFRLDAIQAGIEIKFAIQKLTGKLPPNRIVEVLTPRQYGTYYGF